MATPGSSAPRQHGATTSFSTLSTIQSTPPPFLPPLAKLRSKSYCYPECSLRPWFWHYSSPSPLDTTTHALVVTTARMRYRSGRALHDPERFVPRT